MFSYLYDHDFITWGLGGRDVICDFYFDVQVIFISVSLNLSALFFAFTLSKKSFSIHGTVKWLPKLSSGNLNGLTIFTFMSTVIVKPRNFYFKLSFTQRLNLEFPTLPFLPTPHPVLQQI